MEGSVWSTMESKGAASTPAKSAAKPATTLYSNNGSTTASRNCYRCNKPGHFARDCTEQAATSNAANAGRGRGRGRMRGGKTQTPKHRKFNCAYCKDNTKRCVTAFCSDLRKLDFDTHKQMLDINLDCEKCAGDCPKGACTRNVKKVCGQGIQNRGCGMPHLQHELFCPRAKLFLSAASLCSRITIEDIETNPWGRRKGQVLHQMMHIPPLKSKGSAEVVLWDTGSDTNYVRLEHAIK